MNDPARSARIADLLATLPLFQGLPRSDLETIAARVSGRTLTAGEAVVREGGVADAFYIVHRGSVEVTKERPDGTEQKLAVKGAGDAFGEMALLLGVARTATVRAMEPTQLLVLSREEFDALLGEETLAVRLLRELAKALRTADLRLATRDPTTVGSAARAAEPAGPLTPKTTPSIAGWDIIAAAAPSESVGRGGAVWDAARHDDGPLLAVIDAKGTALPPAYLVGAARMLLRESLGRAATFADVLAELNTSVSRHLTTGEDVVVEVALVSAAGSSVRVAIAGEQPGILLRAAGGAEELEPQGPALGILPDFGFGAVELDLDAGDAVVLFSEADDTLIDAVGALVREHAGSPADALRPKLERLLEQARVRAGLADAVVVVVRKGGA